jgi:hypothetical protein
MANPIDGTINLEVDEKFMNARLSIQPAKNGGKEVTEAMVREAIALNGIRYNIDEDALKSAFTNGGLSVLLAKGDPPVDGKNGYLTYYFERKSGAQMKADEFGNVDFRDLGLIQNIEKDTIIADIFPETQGTPGRDIRGIELPQYPGKPAKIAVGNGVALSEDGNHLMAAIQGNLRWNKDHFVVDKELVVGDIDLSVGNIDFIGDIIIKGNVNEGFVVRSGGNITIAGNVTGSTIEADGSITSKLGFVSSKITAGGDIVVSFGENSEITAEGSIKAQSFVGCTVVCNGPLTVQGGKSVIVGGKYTCLSDIEANYIGSDSYVRTLIVLGNVAVLAEELQELKKSLQGYENQLNQLDMVVNTLQQQKKIAPLTPERDEMLKRSIKAKFSHMGLIKETNERIADIEHEIENNNDLCVKVKRAAFPGVTVRINSAQLVVAQKTGACTIRMNEENDVVIR